MSKAEKSAKSVRPPGEPTKSEMTRRRILDAAARTFATRGYAHTRLSDVAKEANTHAGGIYYYFASREELVSEVLDVCTERTIVKCNAALDALGPDAGAPERLLTVATALLDGILSNDLFNIAHNRIYPQVPDDVRDRHRPLLRRYFTIWRDIVIAGQKSGEFRSDIDPTILRLTIVGSIQWATEWATANDSDAEELARKMMQIFFQGIIPEKTTSKRTPGKAPAASPPVPRRRKKTEPAQI